MTTTDGGRRVVLVTRSEPGATELANALTAAGHSASVCPVLEVRGIDDPAARRTFDRLNRFDVVIFASGHAVRFAFESIEPARVPPRLTWIAVGASTGALLARHGIAAVVPAVESSEGILALPQLSDVVGQRVLVCAGDGGRATIADTLVERGAVVETVALYRREAVPVDRLRTRVPNPSSIAAVVISSAEGGAAFAMLWRAIGGHATVPIVAPSQRVAMELTRLGFERVAVSSGAGAAAVVAALEQLRDEHER
jgi:uroporphyrinogen-III synthase